ncbi:hypothetical protein F4779DRAFT_542971 [Xylariaceae sp. FL0662B]|nr:hypothetical protein F4779DRAFT_542971 [Xylariaceae sp. FL0662B]
MRYDPNFPDSFILVLNLIPLQESDVESITSASDTTFSDVTDLDQAEEPPNNDRTDAMFALTRGTTVREPPKGRPSYHVKAERDKWYRPGKLPKSYFCPECGKGLSRMDSLTRHRKARHHLGRQWHCKKSWCLQHGKAYGRFDHFKTHMERSHGVKLTHRDALKAEYIADPRDPIFGRQSASSSADLVHPQPTVAQSPRIPEANGYRNKAPARPQLDSTDQSRASGSADAVSLDRLSRAELMRMLRSKTQECEQLQKQCKILALEKNEYVEALRLSEEMRARLGDNTH